MNLRLNLGLGTGGSALRPALLSELQQRLTLTADTDPPQPQPFLTVSDSLDILTVPTIESGELRQSDSFFTDTFSNFYSDSTPTLIVDKTFENLLIHYYNTNGSNGLWVKKISDTEWKAEQYVIDTLFVPGQYNQNVRFYGKGGGALRDSGGDLILDAGFVQFIDFVDTLALNTIPPPELLPDLTEIPV